MASSGVNESRDSLVHHIFTNWTLLRAIVETHESTIRTRWTKKSVNKRRATLLATSPSIPPSHRPDIAAFQTKNKARNADHFLTPFINLEDLTKGDTFLIMILSRTSHPPSAFVDVDFNNTRLGWVTGAIKFSLDRAGIMLFRDRDSVGGYGEILERRDTPPTEYDQHVKLGALGSDQGLLALEVQKRTYSFMLDACKCILHDIKLDDVPSVAYGSPPSPKMPARDSGQLTLSALRLESPYRVPAHLDLERLQSITAAFSDASKERLVQLVESPGAFHDYVRLWENHRPEMVFDYTGSTHHTIRFDANNIFPENVINASIGLLIDSIDRWTAVEKRLHQLSNLIHYHSGHISPSSELPDDLTMEFVALQVLLTEFAAKIVSVLHTGVPSSPTFRDYYLRTGKTKDGRLEIIPKSDLHENKTRSALVKVFALLFDETSRSVIGLQSITDEIERLAESAKEARVLLTPWVQDLVSTLSVLAEGLNEIDRFQPWSSAFSSYMDEHEARIRVALSDELPWSRHLGGKQVWKTVAALGKTSGGRFDYPEDRKLTRERTEVMQSSEHNLQEFWSALKSTLSRHDALSPLVKTIIEGAKPIKTAPWAVKQHASTKINEATGV